MRSEEWLVRRKGADRRLQKTNAEYAFSSLVASYFSLLDAQRLRTGVPPNCELSMI